MKSDRETYIGLDIVRFAAAMSVAFYHLAYCWWLPKQASDATYRTAFAVIADPARWGFVGVPVFFVLSGFIIAASALDRTPSEFLKGRVLRLYPAAWICTGITVAAGSSASAADIVRSLALSPVGPWVTWPYWTLGVEIVFYLLIALMLAMRVRLWSLGIALGLISSAFWLLRAADFAAGGPMREMFTAIEASLLGRLLILYSCYFAVGIGLWATKREGLSIGKVVFLGIFVLAGLIQTYANGRFAISDEGGPGRAIEVPLLWLTALFLIAASIRYQPWLWRKFGRWGPAIRTIGLATYPLYLVHNEVGRIIMSRSRFLGPWPALALALTVVIIIAYLTVKLERWPRSLLRRLLNLRSGKDDIVAPQLP